jgi:flagellum-specific peptidoglycan hydrolase FlgJ
MTREQFVQEVAKYVQKYAPQYGIKVYSPIIAQFCLESGYGTTNKVKKVLEDGTVDWRHNYAGLKWRNNRCAISNDYFEEGTSEQNKDKSYTNIVAKFYRFKSLEDCVIGYFQFTNISNYANLKGVTNPKKYLELIKKDGYATSLDYVDKVYNIIVRDNLTRFDVKEETAKKYWRVQCGSFQIKKYAENLKDKLEKDGFDAIIKKYGVLYKIQIGAFSEKKNATNLMAKVKERGYSAFITYC